MASTSPALGRLLTSYPLLSLMSTIKTFSDELTYIHLPILFAELSFPMPLVIFLSRLGPLLTLEASSSQIAPSNSNINIKHDKAGAKGMIWLISMPVLIRHFCCPFKFITMMTKSLVRMTAPYSEKASSLHFLPFMKAGVFNQEPIPPSQSFPFVSRAAKRSLIKTALMMISQNPQLNLSFCYSLSITRGNPIKSFLAEMTAIGGEHPSNISQKSIWQGIQICILLFDLILLPSILKILKCTLDDSCSNKKTRPQLSEQHRWLSRMSHNSLGIESLGPVTVAWDSTIRHPRRKANTFSGTLL